MVAWLGIEPWRLGLLRCMQCDYALVQNLVLLLQSWGASKVGYCEAPTSYAGPCARSAYFNDMSVGEKLDFETRCAHALRAWHKTWRARGSAMPPARPVIVGQVLDLLALSWQGRALLIHPALVIDRPGENDLSDAPPCKSKPAACFPC